MTRERRFPTVPRPHYVYILASQKNGTIYTGSTADLIRRVVQHRRGEFDSFTKEHKVYRLVWFEEHGSKMAAFDRERAIKRWKRAWKIELIESRNPEWRDLFDTDWGT